jgi:hypothetical protein
MEWTYGGCVLSLTCRTKDSDYSNTIQKDGSRVQGMSYTFRPSSRCLRNDRRSRFLRCWFAATWEYFVPFFSHTLPVTIRIFVRIKGMIVIFFSMNRRKLSSEVGSNRKAYPWFHSEKKYSMGRFWPQRAFLGPLLHKDPWNEPHGYFIFVEAHHNLYHTSGP